MRVQANEMAKDHGATFAREWLRGQCSPAACARRASEAHPQYGRACYLMDLTRMPDLAVAALLPGWSARDVVDYSAVKAVLEARRGQPVDR